MNRFFDGWFININKSFALKYFLKVFHVTSRKKFLKTKQAQAKKIKEELEKLDLLKMKREHAVKIVDLLPEDASDLNKIFTDVSLNEDETNKILEIVKKTKQ